MFSNIVHAGQDIKPWLMTGPDFVSMGDVLTERSYFENPDANVGEEAVEQAIAGFSAALQGVIPRETDEITYPYDIKAKWRFLGTPEVYNGFGKYFVTNSLGVVVASCIVYSEKEQSTKMNLFSRWKNRLRLLVNGEVVIDNLELVQVRSKGNFPKEGIVHLKAGANVFNIISMRVSRRVEVGWRLEVLEAEAPLRVETLINMEEDLREELEHAYQKTHMKADTYAEGDDVRMVLGSSRVAQVHITAKDDKGNKVLDLYPESAGELVLLAKAAVGIYTIHVSWMVDEDIMAEKDFSVQVCQVLEPLLGYENYKKRQQIFMRSCADMDVIEAYRESPNVLWCRYALGEYDRITYSMVDFACGFTDRWEDCADFALLPLLMIVYEEQIDAKLPPRYVERIKQAALKFKYWVDEANDSVMWMDSENHRMGFHTLEYLAGILFPQDIFVNSGQNGLFHSIKGRMHLMEWLSQRIRFGYNEFHSDSYLPVTFAPLMVIQKVAPYEEFSLRTMAKELADITVFHLAANNYNGCIASPRGRSYNLPMRNPMQQGTTSILYILFGRDRAAMNPTPGATAAAVSDYMPPEGICNVAYDYSEMVNYYKTGFYHWGNQNANLTAMRTPEYMMSSARNHNLGRCEDHLHVAQVTMPRDIILFFSAPYTRQEGSGLRPDYWAG
ncbi:MAG: hypothetical protein IJ315_04300, partial [Firmicutes bacterium]|nr:hypothetical protein [Bacillota bacterium]